MQRLTKHRYTISTWSIKLEEHYERQGIVDIYELKLILEPCENQTSLEELDKIPSPTQVDEWDTYEKYLQVMKQKAEEERPKPGQNTPAIRQAPEYKQHEMQFTYKIL